MSTGPTRDRAKGIELIPDPDVDHEALYRSEHVRLTRVAALIVGSEHEAQEIVHDAFVTLVHSGRRPDNPPAYVRRMVINACNSRHRRRKVEEKHRPPKPRGVEQPEIDETFRLLAGLPQKHRVAIVLRYYDDMLVNDIADHMTERPGTVKSLLHRGLKSLRTTLETEATTA